MAARILLAEDNQHSLRILVMLLQLNGFYVRGADGYRSAVEAATKEQFDLLISDIEFWDGNGCDLLQHLQGIQSLKGIAVSGYGDEADIRRSLDAGFKAHLVKPIVLGNLLDAIEDALRIVATEQVEMGSGVMQTK